MGKEVKVGPGSSSQWEVGLCSRHCDIHRGYCEKFRRERILPKQKHHQLRINEAYHSSIWHRWWLLWDVRASSDWISKCLTLLELKLYRVYTIPQTYCILTNWYSDSNFQCLEPRVSASSPALALSSPHSILEVGGEEPEGKEDGGPSWNKTVASTSIPSETESV